MVATRKTTNKLGTSYSQMPAQDIWQREAEEAEASEDDTKLPPLSMADGGHLRLRAVFPPNCLCAVFPRICPLQFSHAFFFDFL